MPFILLIDVLKKETFSEKLHEMRYKSELTIPNDKRRKSDTDDKYEDRTLSALGDSSSDSEEISKRSDSQESLSSDSEIIENTYRWPRQNSVCITSY